MPAGLRSFKLYFFDDWLKIAHVAVTEVCNGTWCKSSVAWRWAPKERLKPLELARDWGGWCLRTEGVDYSKTYSGKELHLFGGH